MKITVEHTATTHNEQENKMSTTDMVTFTYSIARTTKDSFGISRPGAVYDLSESDLAEIQSAGHLSDFESAMDLEDGTECADGFDGEGNTIRVYRTKGGH